MAVSPAGEYVAASTAPPAERISSSAMTSEDTATARLRGLAIRGRQPLRHAQAPRVDHEAAHLLRVERREAGHDPVEAQVGLARHQELLRLGADEPLPLLLGEAEPHQRLVPGEGDVHDLPDPELDPAPDDGLVRARERERHRSHVLDRHHGNVPASVSIATGGRVAAAASVGYQTRPRWTTMSEPALVPAAAKVSRLPLHRCAPTRRSSSSRNAPTSSTGIPASQIPSRADGPNGGVYGSGRSWCAISSTMFPSGSVKYAESAFQSGNANARPPSSSVRSSTRSPSHASASAYAADGMRRAKCCGDGSPAPSTCRAAPMSTASVP